MKLKGISILFFILLSFTINAQEEERTSVGLGIGITSYFGDLNTGSFFKDWMKANPSFQLRIAQRHSNFFTTNLNLLYGGLKGDDADSNAASRKVRNLNFKSKLYEISLFEEFHPLGRMYSRGDLFFSPYVGFGIGGFHFNPTTKASDGKTYDLRELGTEGQGSPGYDEKYSLYNFTFLYGVGAKFRLTGKINIKVEFISRYTNTDYLDDVSTNYAPQNVLLANGGPIAVELSDRREIPTYTGQRGFLNNYDYYLTSMVTVTYSIGNIFPDNSGPACPEL